MEQNEQPDILWTVFIHCDPEYDTDRYFDGEPGCVYESGVGTYYAPGIPDMYWHESDARLLIEELGELPTGLTWHLSTTRDEGETWEEVDSGPKP